MESGPSFARKAAGEIASQLSLVAPALFAGTPGSREELLQLETGRHKAVLEDHHADGVGARQFEPEPPQAEDEAGAAKAKKRGRVKKRGNSCGTKVQAFTFSTETRRARRVREISDESPRPVRVTPSGAWQRAAISAPRSSSTSRTVSAAKELHLDSDMESRSHGHPGAETSATSAWMDQMPQSARETLAQIDAAPLDTVSTKPTAATALSSLAVGSPRRRRFRGAAEDAATSAADDDSDNSPGNINWHFIGGIAKSRSNFTRLAVEVPDERERPTSRHVSFGDRAVEVVQFHVEEQHSPPTTTRAQRRVFGGDLQAHLPHSAPVSGPRPAVFPVGPVATPRSKDRLPTLNYFLTPREDGRLPPPCRPAFRDVGHFKDLGPLPVPISIL